MSGTDLSPGLSKAVSVPAISVVPGGSYTLRVIVTSPVAAVSPAVVSMPVKVAVAVATASVFSNASPVAVGSKVTYTAYIVPSLTGLPASSGTVSFQDDSSPITTCAAIPLSHDGKASCTVSYPDAGTHAVTAVYSGDPSLAASTSAPFIEKVDDAGTHSAGSR